MSDTRTTPTSQTLASWCCSVEWYREPTAHNNIYSGSLCCRKLYKRSVGTSNATPERIFSRVTWQSRGRRSYISMQRLDQIVRIQEPVFSRSPPEFPPGSAPSQDRLRWEHSNTLLTSPNVSKMKGKTCKDTERCQNFLAASNGAATV